MASEPLLQVSKLKTAFFSADRQITAVRDVSLSIQPGETLALVGESGSGKSVTALSVMGLLPDAGRIVSGSIRLGDMEVTSLSESAWRSIRSERVAMIFQEPMTSLNPVFRIGSQIAEAVRLHRHTDRRTARTRSIELLDLVGIPEAERVLDAFPHQLSGGMRQRVMIAMALSCEPELLIADEPTTALDVTVQAQILELLRDLGKRLGMGMLFITHDLGVVAEIADRVAVMYAGRIVEEGSVRAIFNAPRMPYTADLMASIPVLSTAAGVQTDRLFAIPGSVPDPDQLPSGCSYNPRCRFSIPECRSSVPELKSVGTDQRVRCIRSGDPGVPA